MMAGIRGKDTKPELTVRRGLHRLGYRYRLHDSKLPGKPDLVLPAYNALIFINGCFWHGHSCSLFKWPATRTEFWKDKIGGNIARDGRNVKACLKLGWRVLKVWECALKGPEQIGDEATLTAICLWLNSDNKQIDGVHEESGVDWPYAPYSKYHQIP